MIISSSLILSIVISGAFVEAREIICAYYPQEAQYARRIAPPNVGLRKRAKINLRKLAKQHGGIDYDNRQVWVSTAGGPKKAAERLRHEFLHWLVRHFILTDVNEAHLWVDYYWSGSTLIVAGAAKGELWQTAR